jgi:hypothetical protein
MPVSQGGRELILGHIEKEPHRCETLVEILCPCLAIQRRIIQQSCQVVAVVAELWWDMVDPLNHGLRMSIPPIGINRRKLAEQFFEGLALAFHCY